MLFEPPPGNRLRPGTTTCPLYWPRSLRRAAICSVPRSIIRPPEWTSRYIKGWFGMAGFKGPHAGRIRINRLLDSADVSAETLVFLMWHECLPLHLHPCHTPEFRRLARLWPAYQACDREMDGLHEKFGVQ